LHRPAIILGGSISEESSSEAKIIVTRFANTRQKSTEIRCVLLRQFAITKTDDIIRFRR
jgi:hypothetical protein